MPRIVKRERQEHGKHDVFYLVTDEDGRIGTVHLVVNKPGSPDNNRLISRDHHVPAHLPGYEHGTRMECCFVGGPSKCDGSSLFDGYSFGTAFVSDERCYEIAASMIDGEADTEVTFDPE